jgi:uncharacterized membrane protein
MAEATGNEARTEQATALWSGLCRLALLFVLAASAALYVQYLDPAEAAFCGLGSGCEAVRRAGFSYFFGSRFLSLPLFGLVAYGTVLVTSLAAPRSRWTYFFTASGAAGAVVLIGLQALFVHAFCWLCLVVDVGALFAALFAHLDDREKLGKPEDARDPLRPVTWMALAIVSIAAPVVWVSVKPAPPVPSVIRALYEPGKINVVEFADFECPFCRKLHPVLQEVLKSYPKDRVRFVRKHVPLPSHEDAPAAARAVICAEEQGKGEELAGKLMELDPLSATGERRAAVGIGVDVERFDRCVASSAPNARIEADTKLLQAAGMQGLPTTYVQGKRLLGAVSEAALRDAFDKAAAGDTDTGLPAPLYVTLVLAALAAIAWLGRSARVTVRHERSA